MFNFDEPPAEQAGVTDLDLSGQNVLITGSTSGIGRAAATALGDLGAHVVVHGRNEDAAAEVVDEIEAGAGSAQFVRADFESPEQVSELAETVADEVETLDVLCNNAGGLFEDTGPTDLGVDRAFHVNHLAPYQLTAELLDTLADDARVVTTSSVAHRGTTLNLDTLLDLTGLSPMAAYCRSKLANVQFANELGRRLRAADREITSNSLHPGVIPGSEFGRAFPGFTTELWQLFDGSPFLDSVEDGAATIVYLAASPEVKDTTGSYFARCKERRAAPQARDEDAQRALWKRSAGILDMEEPLAEYGTSKE